MKIINSKFVIENLKKSETGLAEIFVEYNETKIVYITSSTGYIYDDAKKMYTIVDFVRMSKLIPEVLTKVIEKLKELTKANDLLDDAEKTKKIKSFDDIISSVNTKARIKNIFELLTIRYLNDELFGKFDNQPNVIPYKNGKLIDLETGKVRERTNADYFTYEFDAEYLGSDETKTPKTSEFFKQLSTNNADKYKYLKRVMGSCITAETGFKAFIIFYGELGNNGKSKLLNIMYDIFNKKYATLDADLIFAEKKDKVCPTKFGGLVGKTIGCASEPADRVIHSSIIKMLTGGDQITGKFLYKDAFTFTPTVKIIISANNLLFIEDDKEGIMKRRTRVINFNTQFVENPDPNKPYEMKIVMDIEKLFISEWRSDFFTFIINGAIEFLKTKTLDQPKELEYEKEEYFKKMDHIQRNLNDMGFVITHKSNDIYSKPLLWTEYSEYLANDGKTMKQSAFTDYMIKHFGKPKKTNGEIYYVGIRKKMEEELELDLESKVETKSNESNENNIDYKLLYENSQAENKKLLDEIQKLKEEMEKLKQTTTQKQETVVKVEPKKSPVVIDSDDETDAMYEKIIRIKSKGAVQKKPKIVVKETKIENALKVELSEEELEKLLNA